MLTIPNILDTPEFLDAYLDYKWTEKTSGEYYFNYINEKLSETLWQLNHKSTVGLATALSEYIFWRFTNKGVIELSLISSMLEAMWTGLIDKRYIKDWDYEGCIAKDNIGGPIWVMLNCMNDVRYNYQEGEMFINAKVSTLAAVARLVSPYPKVFDNWIAKLIDKTSNLFPSTYDRKKIFDGVEEEEFYDSSSEFPIPRQFFWEEDFNYQTVDNIKLLKDFLSGIDYKNNEFLNSPEDMLEQGFQGAPYKYEPK